MVSTEKKQISSFKVLLVFLCLTLVGSLFITKLPVKLAPDAVLPTLNISYSMRNMSSRVVEMEVTSKLEGMLSRIQGVQSISSSSDNGSGSINIRLNKHADIEVVRFEVSTMLRQVYPYLPSGVSYPYLSASRSDDASTTPFLTYTLNAPSSAFLIQQYAENNIKNKLSNLAGIDKIKISGAMGMIWKLEYDYQQLLDLKLTVSDIQTAIQQYISKTYLGIGLFETGGSEKRWIRLALAPNELPEKFDASNIVVINKDGKLIQLNELIRVSHQEDEPMSYYRINGLNSVYMSITAKPEANQLQLAKNIKKELTELETHFPANFEIHLSNDATEYIRQQLRTILFRSGLTILILLGFILFIYRNRNYLIMISFSLLGNILIAALVYYLFKLELHIYSLMGITISLNLLIDNIIVMADQIHRQKNRNAFLAILTATMTTIAALVMIFFMDEKIRLNLQDFAAVIIINLATSLIVVLFLVPALMDKLHINQKKKLHSKRFMLREIRFNRIYGWFIRYTSKKRGLVLTAAVFMFGLPFFLLPDKMDDNSGFLAKCYNNTLGTPFYQEKMKPIVNVALGGTLRLFVEKVYQGSYWKSNGETALYVTLSMPNGATLEQTNFLVGQMETYLKQYKRIRLFNTNVSKLNASINIQFMKEDQSGSFPYKLKDELISKAIEFGGGSWGVYGMGDGFSNNLQEYAGSNRIVLRGYNYDELFAWAKQIQDSLLQYRRIKEVMIDSRFSYFKSDYQEFSFDLNKNRLIEESIYPQALYGGLSPLFASNQGLTNWVTSTGIEPIRLSSRQASEYDIWKLKNFPSSVNSRQYHLYNLASIGKYQAPQSIARENQQYLLGIQYEYIGTSEQSYNVLDKTIEKFKTKLPIGYSIGKENDGGWGKKDSKQYWLLLIVIIYFTTSILFNSLKQPLAILLLIPISFVGLFLTFYFFKLNFDQGGFAAFVLLCGITVNVGIYIVNQYNQIQKAHLMDPLKAYVKAWNFRIIPISLTVLSTILGFIPFLIGEKEGFWFPLAAGTIGGLVFSMIGLFLFLPAFLGLHKPNHKDRYLEK